jgi:hypothetical protein
LRRSWTRVKVSGSSSWARWEWDLVALRRSLLPPGVLLRPVIEECLSWPRPFEDAGPVDAVGHEDLDEVPPAGEEMADEE